MKTLLFILTLFSSWLILISGLGTKSPLANFAGAILIWLIYYLLTSPCRRRKQYWRERRRLQDDYMRAYIRNNKFYQ